MFSTPVEACVAVVVDPNHERYGQEASIYLHDWREYGTVFTTFSDGEKGQFNDGLFSKTDLPQVEIMNRDDTEDIESLKARLPQIKEQLLGLIAVNGVRIRPEEERAKARNDYFDLIRNKVEV